MVSAFFIGSCCQITKKQCIPSFDGALNDPGLIQVGWLRLPY